MRGPNETVPQRKAGTDQGTLVYMTRAEGIPEGLPQGSVRKGRIGKPESSLGLAKLSYLLTGIFSVCLTISIGWNTGSDDPFTDSASTRWRKGAGPEIGA